MVVGEWRLVVGEGIGDSAPSPALPAKGEGVEKRLLRFGRTPEWRAVFSRVCCGSNGKPPANGRGLNGECKDLTFGGGLVTIQFGVEITAIIFRSPSSCWGSCGVPSPRPSPGGRGRKIMFSLRESKVVFLQTEAGFTFIVEQPPAEPGAEGVFSCRAWSMVSPSLTSSPYCCRSCSRGSSCRRGR